MSEKEFAQFLRKSGRAPMPATASPEASDLPDLPSLAFTQREPVFQKREGTVLSTTFVNIICGIAALALLVLAASAALAMIGFVLAAAGGRL